MHHRDLGDHLEIANGSEALVYSVTMAHPFEEAILVNGTAGNVTDNYSYAQRPETYIVPTLFAIIFTVGVLGNGTLVKIFVSHASMRSRANSFVICLASGDLLVMLGSIPFTSLIYTFDSWPFGLVACKASEFFRDLSTGVSIFSLTMLSVDRYTAVASPTVTTLYHECGSSRRRITSRTRVVIFGVWLVAAILAAPSAFFSYLMEVEVGPDRHILVCYPFPDDLGPLYPKVTVTFKFVTYYAAPITIIVFFYSLIAWILLHEPKVDNKSLSAMLTSAEVYRRQKRLKVVKMVLVLVILFAICYLPSHIFLLWFYYSFPASMEHYNGYWHTLKIAGYLLSFCNSCLNPVILYFISKKYRMYFRQYLIGCHGNRTKGHAMDRRLGQPRNHRQAMIRKMTPPIRRSEPISYKFQINGTGSSVSTTKM
ncbi:Neuropeptide CCHamide-1 receptor [Halotydeus destructor]|nr:Neuropeptide CCHamide-1 receptor [Halotydeus destructor]